MPDALRFVSPPMSVAVARVDELLDLVLLPAPAPAGRVALSSDEPISRAVAPPSGCSVPTLAASSTEQHPGRREARGCYWNDHL